MTSVRAALGALALSVVPVVTGVGPARAAEPPDCTVSSATEVPQLSDRRSRPLDLLDVADAQQVVSAPGGVRPGSGVTVAVVDSGIAPQDQVTVVAAHSVHTGSAVVHTSDYHGTAVAGLIAGRARPNGAAVGIAPGARLVDVQVYGWAEGSTGRPAQASRTDLVAGLEWLAGQVRGLSVDIAVVPLAVEPDASLAAAVRHLQAEGVLVVARIITTASGTSPEPAGSAAATSRYFGAGVVQPVDALTRPLTSAGDGSVRSPRGPRRPRRPARRWPGPTLSMTRAGSRSGPG